MRKSEIRLVNIETYIPELDIYVNRPKHEFGLQNQNFSNDIFLNSLSRLYNVKIGKQIRECSILLAQFNNNNFRFIEFELSRV